MIPHLEEMQHYTNVICVKYPDKPWERVEWDCYSDNDWRKHGEWHPAWRLDAKYRFLPDTINVNGVELPEPLRVEPKDGDKVWSPFVRYNGGTLCSFSYDQFAVKDVKLLSEGFLHATQENAQAWLDYFVKLARGE